MGESADDIHVLEAVVRLNGIREGARGAHVCRKKVMFLCSKGTGITSDEDTVLDCEGIWASGTSVARRVGWQKVVSFEIRPSCLAAC